MVRRENLQSNIRIIQTSNGNEDANNYVKILFIKLIINYCKFTGDNGFSGGSRV